MNRRVGRPQDRQVVLFLSQVYPPDPAAIGQYVADAAREMVRRGHRVVVYTASRGYDDPSLRYPSREMIDGVEVRRLPLSSFGKRTMLHRIVGAGSYLAQCFFAALFIRGVSGILHTTVPPGIAFSSALAGRIRGVPTAYWVMDLNPDQLIALGKLPAQTPAARALEQMNRFALRNARVVVALDKYMAARLVAKTPMGGELEVIPPWPLEDDIQPVPHEDNFFRAANGLDGRFVVMYSGNHSPSNPLTTLLEAAVRLRHENRLCFVFIGGGVGKSEVEAYIARHRLGNVLSLPYQPLASVRYSLSAADVHAVSLGDQMVGIIHPSKLYGAMAVARPILYFGPSRSPIAEIVEAHAIGFAVAHGDVDGAEAAIRGLLESDPAVLREMGLRARAALRGELGQQVLCGKLCDRIEAAFARAPSGGCTAPSLGGGRTHRGHSI